MYPVSLSFEEAWIECMTKPPKRQKSSLSLDIPSWPQRFLFPAWTRNRDVFAVVQICWEYAVGSDESTSDDSSDRHKKNARSPFIGAGHTNQIYDKVPEVIITSQGTLVRCELIFA